MEVLRDGSFTLLVGTKSLARGLRPFNRDSRNSEYLTQCKGAVGFDGVLQVIDDLQKNRIATEGVITDGFPYPQIFICREVTIICGKTAIYEFGSLIPKLTGIPAGLTWTCIDYGPFIYLSNCTVTVVRDAQSGEYDYADYISCKAGCDNNNQAVIAPCQMAGVRPSPTTAPPSLPPTTAVPELKAFLLLPSNNSDDGVYKVRCSDMAILGPFLIDDAIAQGSMYSIAIDSNNKLAYIGTQGGFVIAINIDTGDVIAYAQFPTEFIDPESNCAIDLVNRNTYFYGSIIVIVPLTSSYKWQVNYVPVVFAVVLPGYTSESIEGVFHLLWTGHGDLVVPYGDTTHCVAESANYIFLGTEHGIVQIDKSTFTILQTNNTLGFTSENYPKFFYVDEANGFLYVCNGGYPVYKLSLTDLSLINTISSGGNSVLNYAAVCKIPLDNLSGGISYEIADSAVLDGDTDLCIIDKTNTFLYVSVAKPTSGNYQCFIIKISLDLFEEVAELVVAPNHNDVYCGAITSDFLYVGADNGITKISLADFSVALNNNSLGFSSGNYPQAMAVDETTETLYVATAPGSGYSLVYRLSLDTLNVLGEPLSLPFQQPMKAMILDGFLYITQFISSGGSNNKLTKIDLDTFTIVSTIDLTHSEGGNICDVGACITGFLE